MRLPTAGLIALCSLFAVLCAHAQELSVTYLEGSIQVRNGAGWSEMAIGDTVPHTASIRVDAGGSVELKGTTGSFFLTRPGTYVIRDIVAAHKSMASGGTGSALSSAFRYLARGAANRQTTVLGARARDSSKSDAEQWVESSAEVFLEAGREYISAGQYAKAREQFTQALESATEKEIPQIRYYMAYTCSQEGKLTEAWKQAEGLKPASGDAWAGDFILLKAKMLVDSSAYAEAAQWLSNEGEALSRDAQRAPLYYFLLGLACGGSGDHAAEKASLSKAVSLSGDNDIGRSAAQLLQDR